MITLKTILYKLAELNTACVSQHGIVGIKVSLWQKFTDLFGYLFDTSNWPPRWQYGNWSKLHGWIYIISDLLIWASYLAIPIILYSIFKKRRDLPFRRIFFLFSVFITLCGTTHLIDAIIFWWPIFRLGTLVKFLTAVASVFAVYALYRLLPVLLSLRTMDELEQEILERKAIEEKLSASEFLLSEAGRLGRVGGWEVDLRTNKSTWSKTIFEIYGLPDNTPIDAIDAFGVFAEEYRKIMLDALQKLREEGTPWDLELLMATKTGQLKWVRSYGQPLYDQTGTLIKIRGVLMDIDRYKSSEMNLNTSLELLTTQNNQLKGFAHILSHNIRNHSSNITMLLSFVDVDTLDAGNTEIFNKIAVVAKGLNVTLNDLSEAIKVRESVLVKETMDFKAVTEAVVVVLQTDITVNNVLIDLDFEVPTVNFPAIYLQSIIMNLISNGIKYRKVDEDPLICLRTYIGDNGKKILECIDNGIGIDLSLYGNKIFGLYKTFHNRMDAHGVGLFLIKNQVESQGGTIEVFSQPAMGTTFKITFNN